MSDQPLTTQAQRPGRCACCMTPYEVGTELAYEFGKLVLINHPSTPANKPRRPRGDYHDPNAIPRPRG